MAPRISTGSKKQRKEKRLSYGKGLYNNGGGKGKGKGGQASLPASRTPKAQGVSNILSQRKSRDNKGAVTKDAVKKSDAAAKAILARASKNTAVKTPLVGAAKNKKNPASRGNPKNGRVVGRQLIRWNPYYNQQLIVNMVYELAKEGVSIPWDRIGERVGYEKETSGASIQQHVNKLRHRILNRGEWAPPLAGRPGQAPKKGEEKVRGVKWLMGEDGNIMRGPKGKPIEVVIEWGDEIPPQSGRYDGYICPKTGASLEEDDDDDDDDVDDNDDESVTPVPQNPTKLKKKTSASPKNEIDPTYLDGEADFDPAITVGHRVTRASLRMAKKHYADDDNDPDIDMEGMGEGVDNAIGSMPMAFLNDDEQEQVDRKIAILKVKPRKLAGFPAGIYGNGNDDYDSDEIVERQSVAYSSSDEGVIEYYDSDVSDEDSEEGSSENGAKESGDNAANTANTGISAVGSEIGDAEVAEYDLFDKNFSRIGELQRRLQELTNPSDARQPNGFLTDNHACVNNGFQNGNGVAQYHSGQTAQSSIWSEGANYPPQGFSDFNYDTLGANQSAFEEEMACMDIGNNDTVHQNDMFGHWVLDEHLHGFNPFVLAEGHVASDEVAWGTNIGEFNGEFDEEFDGVFDGELPQEVGRDGGDEPVDT